MRAYPILLALGLFASCGADESEASHDGHDHAAGDHGHSHGEQATSATPASLTVASGVHDLKCGCAIEEVGACAPYAELAGSYVELSVPDGSVDEHSFCGQDGLKAEIAGEVKDGKLVASSFAYVD